jgi:hypothetical protein
MTSSVEFDYLAHLVTVPVRAAGVETRFVLDTGIGVNLVSQALAARAGCVRVGIFDIHAMAGLEGVDGFLSLTYFPVRASTCRAGSSGTSRPPTTSPALG